MTAIPFAVSPEERFGHHGPHPEEAALGVASFVRRCYRGFSLSCFRRRKERWRLVGSEADDLKGLLMAHSEGNLAGGGAASKGVDGAVGDTTIECVGADTGGKRGEGSDFGQRGRNRPFPTDCRRRPLPL